jgi:hypothetical protein
VVLKSPATRFVTALSRAQADTPVVMAARLVMRDSQCVVSLAYLNTATREIGATEFVDDDQFCAFDAACVQVGSWAFEKQHTTGRHPS